VWTTYQQNPVDLDYGRGTVKELEAELRKRKVQLSRDVLITGKKAELVARLKADDLKHGGDLYVVTRNQVAQYLE